ncbi:MAG: hypothetical protein DRI40_07595 [Chloroflexi bacterium]|nr:MAG: hypothetical protein DRI40_07595 [Chloroflexota bacterium]
MIRYSHELRLVWADGPTKEGTQWGRGVHPHWVREIGMTSNLFGSIATFRSCTAEKVSFVLLNQLDLILTLWAISLGLSELNPWVNALVSTPALLVLVKAVVPLFIAWLVPGRLLLPASALLAAVVAWDISQLLAFLI